MELVYGFRRVFHNESRKWIFLVVVVAVTHLLFQSLMLPYGNALKSLFPDMNHEKDGLFVVRSSTKDIIFRNPLTFSASDLKQDSSFSGIKGQGGNLENGIRFERASEAEIDRFSRFRNEDNSDIDTGLVYENQENPDESSASDNIEEMKDTNSVTFGDHEVLDGNSASPNVKDRENVSIIKNVVTPDHEISTGMLLENKTSQLPKEEIELVNDVQSSLTNSRNSSAGSSGKKSANSEMPSVTTIDEMNRILEQHHRSSQLVRTRWTSVRDQELLAARSLIESAPIVNDEELYAPVFRNVSTFRRSYELMERTLKVYIYKDGSKPIFHQPVLKGLYASEGWFMKLLQGSKHFVVKDPKKAHLFYMPFSSRMLEYTLYDRNSHDWTNLRDFLKNYTEKIAAKYPFWNRTGGTDHFLAACHDWAPYETKNHMEHCIRALCNADVTAGFKIGRDVSLPETFIRSPRNPLRRVGGKPPSKRNILAFYAGGMHGYVRPILLKHWKNKDPEMKIFGQMPRSVETKMNYIQHMKSSKFCICPKGYEVNSPRVVEAISYECVPVIISDNFVPPFFEVLNWEAFSVIVAEKDILKLKEILVSIPEEKYLAMQYAVRKVQRHFLWHSRPEKYDIFHMTLHSIWYNRIYQMEIR